MKKYLSLFLILVVMLLVNTQIVRAEDGENEIGGEKLKLKTEMEGRRDQIRTKTNDKMELLREDARKKMEGLKMKNKEEKDGLKMKTKELRIVGREKALERFDKAIERITDLKDRINTHINKLEAKEVAVVDAKKFVAIADTKIKDAKDKITEINLLFSLSIDKLTMENKTKLKTLIKSTQTLIVEAHKALKDAIKSLKDGVKIKMESEVSTTIEDNQ